MKKITFLEISLTIVIAFCFLITNSYAQVGVGTTTPTDGSILDVSSATKGLMIPNVNITDLTTLTPVVKAGASPEPISLLVWNTNTTTGVGFHYWDGNDWISISGGPSSNDWTITGNTGHDGGNVTTPGTNFIGTTDNQNMDFRTNNIFRGRFSSLGEFFVGTTQTILPGDLMNAVGNVTFPWAVNGYTNQNGAGVYGSVTTDGIAGTGGNTIFAGVQGEYMGTNINGPGVRGITFTTTAGTNFTGTTVSGVNGSLGTGSLQRSFGVMGDTGDNFTIRVGGVLGTDLFASGALGYYASNGISYGLYAFGNGIVTGGAGGRSSNSNSTTDIDTHVGLGAHGGFLGGWLKGNEYGAIFSGRRFGSYTHGKNITNDNFVVLDEKPNGEKVATYVNTSISIDIQSKGIGQLNNGYSRIEFTKDFYELIDANKPIIVTVTPFGESKGVHLVSIDRTGFVIKENSNGNSNIQFNWIAIAEKSNKDKTISKELLTKDFDANSQLFMHNDNLDGGKAMWFENGKIRFGDKASINPIKLKNQENRIDTSKPKKVKKEEDKTKI